MLIRILPRTNESQWKYPLGGCIPGVELIHVCGLPIRSIVLGMGFMKVSVAKIR